jgi:hypothetical protein
MGKAAMSASLDSLVGELQITAGARQSMTPATQVVTAPRRAARGRAADTLYVLVEVGGAASGVLGEMIQRLRDAYWATPGSVTAALRAAITAGGEWLMDRNLNAPAPDRQNGGLSCAVLRGSEVIIAQAGPASAYIAQHGLVQHYPAPDADPVTPLGIARATEVRFARADLRPGDLIVLTDARWAARVSIEAVARATVSVSVAQALTNLEHLTGSNDLIAVAIEAAGAPDVNEPVAVPQPNRFSEVTTQPSLRGTKQSQADRREIASFLAMTQAEQLPSEPTAPIISAAPQPARPIERATPKAAPPPVATANEPAREPRAATAKVWLGALFQGARRSAGSVGTAGRIMVQRTLPEPSKPRRQPSAAPRGSNLAARSLNTPVLAGIALGIPILVSLLVATVYIQGSSKAELDTRLVSAQNAIVLANQRTGAEARTQWQIVIEQSSEALQFDPGSVTAAEQLAQAQLAIDRLDNVVRLKPVSLWDFKSIGAHRLALQGFSLFVLDRGTNEIDRITLNAAGDALEGNGPEKVLSANTTIDQRPSGSLVDMTWLSSSENRSTSSLIVALQGGLLEYNLAFGWKTPDFGANTMPDGARRLRSFNGNLYLLDPAASQVWRYAPKGDGYPDKPAAYFEQPAPVAAQAIDLVIDGSIYVVTGDGQIAKYSGGKPEAFQVTGLPTPLTRVLAAAVDVNLTDSSLYLALPGGLMQLRPDGKFVRQFRATGTAFETIEDLLIDEQNGRVFVISRGVLYTAALPPIQ